jgi:hypothetical protein
MGMIVFALGLFVPSVRLFGAVRKHENLQRLYAGRSDIPGGREEAKRVVRLLEHMLVFVVLQAVTSVLDPFLG